MGWATRWEDVWKFARFVDTDIRMVAKQQFITDDMGKTPDVHLKENASTMSQLPPGPSPPPPSLAQQPFQTRLPDHWRTPTITTSTSNGSNIVHPTVSNAQTMPTPASLSHHDHVQRDQKHRPNPVIPAAAAAAASPPILPTPTTAASSSLSSFSTSPSPSSSVASPYILSSLTLYPIKSCRGIHVQRWWIRAPMQHSDTDTLTLTTATTSERHDHVSQGGGGTLFLDREFLLLDGNGSALTLKLHPKLQMLHVEVDVRRQRLILKADEMEEELEVKLDGDGDEGSEDGHTRDNSSPTTSVSLCSLRVCNSTAQGYICNRGIIRTRANGTSSPAPSPTHTHTTTSPFASTSISPVTAWLTSFVGQSTYLVRKSKKIQWPILDDHDIDNKHANETVKTNLTNGSNIAAQMDGRRAEHHQSTSESLPLASPVLTTPSPSPCPSSPSTSTSTSTSCSALSVHSSHRRSHSPTSSPCGSSCTTPTPPSVSTPTSLSASASASATASLSASRPQSIRSSYANENDFLLINEASVQDIERRMKEYLQGHTILKREDADVAITPSRFRPNFVLSSHHSVLSPYAEDHWQRVHIGPYSFRVSGLCARCTVVNVDPATGQRRSPLFATLHAFRKKEDGRITFGALLNQVIRRDEQQMQQSDATSNHDSHSDPMSLQPSTPSSSSSPWWSISVGMPCWAE